MNSVRGTKLGAELLRDNCPIVAMFLNLRVQEVVDVERPHFESLGVQFGAYGIKCTVGI